ncbi:hypothetical protein [Agromyces bracchium]|uniref:Uncharacterized protein n=1 Tax=Agromyces bracchium TaxID=88376 RepID=A0A6I3MAE1_9MICO|nr:hypothetical protein [Agromyces bracchium]MTH69728.1 hypothetical protein [Agromyces bracchium]
MSSTTPGSEPDRRDLDGDGLSDRPAVDDGPTTAEATDATPTTDHAPGDDVAAEQADVDPTAPDAERVDRVEHPDAAPDPTTQSSDVEHGFTGTDAAAEPVPAEPLPATDPDAAAERSELDAAVERARTEHPPVVDETAVIDEHPEPVRAAEVRRETGVPETVGAAGIGAAAGVGAATAAPETPAPPLPQTIYVQAPTPPKEKGNRGFGVLVGLIATVAFALLYAGISYLVITWYGAGRGDGIRVYTEFLAQPVFWIPVIFFFLAFALLAAILNRAAWWTWAVFGLAIGIVVYFSYIGAALLTVAAWQFTPQQAADFVAERWVDPFAIIAFIVARELPIWFGGWVAARGRTVGERNVRAREEYDRQLAAGPQPVTPTR